MKTFEEEKQSNCILQRIIFRSYLTWLHVIEEKNRSKCKNNVLSIFEQEIKNSQPLTAVLMRSSLLSDSAVICPTNTKTADWEGKRHGEELKRNRWPKRKENDDKETKRTKTFDTINQRNAEVRLAALASAITRSERVLEKGM